MGLWVNNGSAEVDANSRYPSILGACICLTICMVIIVGLRAYIRCVLLKAFAADDWAILLGMVCSVVYNGLAIGQSKWGLGLHLQMRPKADLNNYSVINYAGRPFYMAGITAFEVSLCLACLRILPPSSRIYKRIIWAVMILAFVSHLGGTLVLLFQCRPVRKSWLPLTSGACLANDTTFFALAAVTILCDLTILPLPLPLLIHSRISPYRKVALIGGVSLGIFTTVCSIMRMIQIFQIASGGDSTMLVLWGTIEMNVGIILTCMPVMKPLFKLGRGRSSHLRGQGQSNSYFGHGYFGHGKHFSTQQSSRNAVRNFSPIDSRHRNSDAGDNESQDFILDDIREQMGSDLLMKNKMSGNVLRTTDITIMYDHPIGASNMDRAPAQQANGC